MKQFIIICISLFFVVACQSSFGYKTVTFEDKYSLTIPAILTETDDLHAEAALQLKNEFIEFYVLVFDESKEEINDLFIDANLPEYYDMGLENYSNLIWESLNNNFEIYNYTGFFDLKINGLPAKYVEFNGKFSDIDIYYSLTVIEGEKNFYQISSWTLTSMESRNKEKIDEIKFTFKELN